MELDLVGRPLHSIAKKWRAKKYISKGGSKVKAKPRLYIFTVL